MPPASIRPALPSDAPALLAHMHAFNAFEGILYDPRKVGPALVRLLDDASIGFVRVASVDRTIVGYLIVTFGFDLEFAGRDAFVTELFVDEAHRGVGIARRLLAV